MKIRTDFVTNSSSSSFILPESDEVSSLYDAACLFVKLHNMGCDIVAQVQQIMTEYPEYEQIDISDLWNLENDHPLLIRINQYLNTLPFKLDKYQLDYIRDNTYIDMPDPNDFKEGQYVYSGLAFEIIDHKLAPDHFLRNDYSIDEAVYWYTDSQDYLDILVQFEEFGTQTHDEDVLMVELDSHDFLRDNPQLIPDAIRSLGRFGFYDGSESLDMTVVQGLAQMSTCWCNHMG